MYGVVDDCLFSLGVLLALLPRSTAGICFSLAEGRHKPAETIWDIPSCLWLLLMRSTVGRQPPAARCNSTKRLLRMLPTAQPDPPHHRLGYPP